MDEIEDFCKIDSNEVINSALIAMEKLKKYYNRTDFPAYYITTSMLFFLSI
jgi:hypothetical protein